MNNFVMRTLSGILFVALIVGSILLNHFTFAAVFALISGLAVLEFHKLTNSNSVSVNLGVGLFGALLLFLSSFLHASGILPGVGYSIYGFYIVVVLVSELYRKKTNPLHNWAYFIMGQIFCCITILIIVVYCLCVWLPTVSVVGCICNYLGERYRGLFGWGYFGKTPFVRTNFPKKSWEGFFGGATVALLSGYVFSLLIPEVNLVQWFLFSEIIVVFGTYGDLIESLLKRTVNVKDSGTIIPGHGGILDRFDSMLLAAPVIFIYLSILFK